MASVEIDTVVKKYGAAEVVHGVSAAIADGEFVVLVGPSGCGKSTLLRMIAGLEDITGGEILIGGTVVNEVVPKERNIAMVFQNYALYPHMTVAQNMGFSLKLLGVPRAEIKGKVDEAAGVLGLEELLDRYPGQLSGGQRQRAAMGRAIVRDPQVFLFDEPLSNLDAKLRVQMRAEIKALHQRLKTTTVYVTHDQIEAMTMADRIVVMNAGAIEQVGTPLDLYDNPTNVFVAGFMGSPAMNLLEGRIETRDGGPVFRTARGAALPLDPQRVWPEGAECIYGIRPEHLAPGRGEDAVEGTVTLVEPTGAETHVVMEIGGEPFTGVFRERISAEVGTAMCFVPDITKLHIFDKATGERLEGTAPASQTWDMIPESGSRPSENR